MAEVKDVSLDEDDKETGHPTSHLNLAEVVNNQNMCLDEDVASDESPQNVSQYPETQRPRKRATSLDQTPTGPGLVDSPTKLPFLLNPKAHCIMVIVGTKKCSLSRIAIERCLSLPQFLFAQHYHPKRMADITICFISADGKHSTATRDNQLKHHPEQRVLAFALEDASVAYSLGDYFRSWESDDLKRLSHARELSLSPDAGAGKLPSYAGARSEAVLVVAGGIVRGAMACHVITASHFIQAQFANPAGVLAFEVVFVRY